MVNTNAAHPDMQTSKGGDHIHVCQWHSFQEFLLNVLSMQYSSTTDDSKLEAVQFGYTEIATHFNLTYLTGENDHSVFPGMYIVCVTVSREIFAIWNFRWKNFRVEKFS